MSLITHLQQIPDFCTQPCYLLWVILLLVSMGTMSGAQGYRALEAFVERHQPVLLELLALPYIRVDFVALATAFNEPWRTTFTNYFPSSNKSALLQNGRFRGQIIP